jgi:secreted trypsin-like serine protease
MRPRIVGGKTLTKNLRPWLVYIEIKAQGNNFHCGGSIINKRWHIFFLLPAAERRPDLNL